MKLLRRYAATLASILTLLLASPVAVHAYTPFNSVNCSGNASSSVVCSDASKTGDPISGKDGLILKVADIIAFVAGLAAVLIIVIAGLRFITSNGNSDSVAGARRAIIYATIGIVVIVLARTLVGYVIGSL